MKSHKTIVVLRLWLLNRVPEFGSCIQERLRHTVLEHDTEPLKLLMRRRLAPHIAASAISVYMAVKALVKCFESSVN